MKKIISFILLLNIGYACSCNTQVLYAYGNEEKKITAVYKVLGDEIDKLTKRINELNIESIKENNMLNYIITTEKNKLVKLYELEFYVKKATQYPFETVQNKASILNTKMNLLNLNKSSTKEKK